MSLVLASQSGDGGVDPGDVLLCRLDDFSDGRFGRLSAGAPVSASGVWAVEVSGEVDQFPSPEKRMNLESSVLGIDGNVPAKVLVNRRAPAPPESQGNLVGERAGSQVLCQRTPPPAGRSAELVSDVAGFPGQRLSVAVA